MHRVILLLPMLALAIGFGRAASPEPADAFELPTHSRIVADGLRGQMGGEAINGVIRGNRESDVHQMAPERHFDSAKNPEDICREWGEGFQRFMTNAVKMAAPKGLEKRELEDREGALFAFGAATHSIQDFYSHTNWVELHIAQNGWNGTLPPTAPLAGVSCDASALPAELVSGYASVIWFAAQFGRSWCGPLGAPDGFEHCHDTLAKDEETTGHGGQPVADGGPTYHEVAVKLATTATRQAMDELRRRVIAAYDSEETDGECVWRKLAWGGAETCQRLWRIDGSLRDVTITNVEGHDPNGHITYNATFSTKLKLLTHPSRWQSWSEYTPEQQAEALKEHERGMRGIEGEGTMTVTVSSFDLHPGTTYNCRANETITIPATIHGRMEKDTFKVNISATSGQQMVNAGCIHATTPQPTPVFVAIPPIIFEPDAPRQADDLLRSVKMLEIEAHHGQEVNETKAAPPMFTGDDGKRTVTWNAKVSVGR